MSTSSTHTTWLTFNARRLQGGHIFDTWIVDSLPDILVIMHAGPSKFNRRLLNRKWRWQRSVVESLAIHSGTWEAIWKWRCWCYGKSYMLFPLCFNLRQASVLITCTPYHLTLGLVDKKWTLADCIFSEVTEAAGDPIWESSLIIYANSFEEWISYPIGVWSERHSASLKVVSPNKIHSTIHTSCLPCSFPTRINHCLIAWR